MKNAANILMNEVEKRKLWGTKFSYVAQSAAAAFNPAHRLIKQTIEASVSHKIGKSEDLEKEDSYKNLSLAELEDLLQKAVSDENYEVAAKIRDEISKR